jgi:hypothetical protein
MTAALGTNDIWGVPNVQQWSISLGLGCTVWWGAIFPCMKPCSNFAQVLKCRKFSADKPLPFTHRSSDPHKICTKATMWRFPRSVRFLLCCPPKWGYSQFYNCLFSSLTTRVPTRRRLYVENEWRYFDSEKRFRKGREPSTTRWYNTFVSLQPLLKYSSSRAQNSLIFDFLSKKSDSRGKYLRNG